MLRATSLGKDLVLGICAGGYVTIEDEMTALRLMDMSLRNSEMEMDRRFTAAYPWSKEPGHLMSLSKMN